MSALPMLLIVVVLLVLLPFLFGELMLASLSKLHLSPILAFMCMVAIFAGSLVNIPVKSIVRGWDVIEDPLAIFGLPGFWPQLKRVRRRTIIAVNVGGCLVPAALALYEIVYLAAVNRRGLAALGVGCIANVIVCYLVARPVPGVGIAMPGAVSPVVATLLALLLAPEVAPPVAFVIGVTGPLVGADLLHLRDIQLRETGVVSIGGAGTFDGIVLSGVVAAYLA
jgi:uncharacterized membrane protein